MSRNPEARHGWPPQLAAWVLLAGLVALHLPWPAAAAVQWTGRTAACGFSASGSTTIYRLELVVDGQAHRGRVILHNIWGTMFGPFAGEADAKGQFRRGIKLGYADHAELDIWSHTRGRPTASINGCDVELERAD